MSKYIVKHSLSCDELGLKQVDDIFETEDEKLVERLGNLIEKHEIKTVTEDTDNELDKPINIPDPIEPIEPDPIIDDLDSKTKEELIVIAKEKGIKGNLNQFREETLKEKIRETK